MKWLLFFIACLLSAHDIITTKLTFTRDISRIFARRCESCHSASASIPLVSYEQVRPWAVSIKEQVLSRQMPPWGAVKGFGQLSPDSGLSQEEIMIVAAWVIGGAPRGNLVPLPESLPAAGNLASVKDLMIVRSRVKIRSSITIAGVRPISRGAVESARITVTYPDGRVEPLVWLYHYDPAWKQAFRFRAPMRLPVGAVIQSGAPLEFALLGILPISR